MQDQTNYITILSISAGLLFCCGSLEKQFQEGNQTETEPVACLLARADTLSGIVLLGILDQLPSTQQDSFFLQRFLTLDQRRADQAIQEILSMYKSLQPDSGLLDGMESLFAGKGLSHLGRFSEAELYLTYCLSHCRELGLFTLASLAATEMCVIRKEQNRHQEALLFQEQYVQFKDSVFHQEKQQLIREISRQHTVHQKELHMEFLKRENQLYLQRNSMAIATLLLFCSIFYLYRKRTNRKAQKIAAANTLAKAHATKLEQVVEQKNNELESHRNRLEEYSKELMEKNGQLQYMEEEAAHASLSEEGKQANQDELYHLAILTDADWERFQQYFAQVHPGYISRLRQQLPDLTPAELRIILLGKLGLSTKEASAILGISIHAVKKGRYRLRKKYNLDSDDYSDLVGHL